MDEFGFRRSFIKSALYMDTIVNLKVVTSQTVESVEKQMQQAFESFHHVEQVCSRFLRESEVMHLLQQIGKPVQVSDILFEAIRFAWEVASFTDGAFDPTVGYTLESYGFNRHYLTREHIVSQLNPETPVSYHDVEINGEKRTVLLHKPLIIDLGAVAKGLAIDLAVKALCCFEGFVIDAGGDIYAGGTNERGEPWHIGIRHPLRKQETITTLKVTNAAVCTSGGYERISTVKEEIHHLLDPKSKTSRSDILSCTVVAPFAMMADAFSTATFIQGQQRGFQQLENAGIEGILVTSSLELHQTNGMKRYLE